jgi:hypothetical protein
MPFLGVGSVSSYNETPAAVSKDYSSHSFPSLRQGASQTPGNLPGTYVPTNLQYPSPWDYGNCNNVLEPARLLSQDSTKGKGKLRIEMIDLSSSCYK